LSDWVEFSRDLPGIAGLKSFINITLFGSYCPQFEKDLLARLRDRLIIEEYKLTKLVEDFPDENFPTEKKNAFDKSIACLEFSDVNILIFTFAGKKNGVVRELAHCTSSLKMIDRRWRCVICEEVKSGKGAIPMLSNEEFKKFSVSRMLKIQFENEAELQLAIRGTAWKYVNDLSIELYYRMKSLRRA